MPPRTHQTKKTPDLASKAVLPEKKFTNHASAGNEASDVADQYEDDVWTFVKGWPAGKVGPGDATEGSIRLESSANDGTRQALRPPTILNTQSNLA